MTATSDKHYQSIEKAIVYINAHFKAQPSLGDIAEHVGLSPFHFQKLFSQWAGLSPKQFLQLTRLEYAKQLLLTQQASLLDAAHETGLSGTGRLHDLFTSIERMTPGEFKRGGQSLTINYTFQYSQFGKLLVASTHKGICYVVFSNDEPSMLESLKRRYPNALFEEKLDVFAQQLMQFFRDDCQSTQPLPLHVYATDFQLKVWEALLRIPSAQLQSYGDIAQAIAKPNAVRAVGTAIGNNPVAYIIPCHRVIRASGELGGYRWGLPRKQAMIAWEAAKCSDPQ